MIQGTIVNGQVQLDEPSNLPEGTRVTLAPVVEAFEYPHPMAPYQADLELTLLQESIEDMKAGRIRSARDALREMAERHDLPLEPGE
jgi:hypothetical protein